MLGLRVGSTVVGARLGSAGYDDTLAAQFSSLTPENDLKWYATEPSRGDWHFAAADADLAFADASGIELKGHNLVWSQDQYTPGWVKAISSADELRVVLVDHIATEVGRYAGRIKRWDVVNEPLAQLGTSPSDSVFRRVLGKGWIAEAFAAAQAADPAAELWLNEYGTDWVSGKRAALLRLVTSLKAKGVRIDGVGIEMHRTSLAGPSVSELRSEIRALGKIGVEVALSEVDVPIPPGLPGGLRKQAAAYARIASACLRQSSCVEITTWGLDDAHSWLDSLGIFPTPTRPLLFDEQLEPKPAFVALRDCLARAVLERKGRLASAPACLSGS